MQEGLTVIYLPLGESAQAIPHGISNTRLDVGDGSRDVAVGQK